MARTRSPGTTRATGTMPTCPSFHHGRRRRDGQRPRRPRTRSRPSPACGAHAAALQTIYAVLSVRRRLDRPACPVSVAGVPSRPRARSRSDGRWMFGLRQRHRTRPARTAQPRVRRRLLLPHRRASRSSIGTLLHGVRKGYAVSLHPQETLHPTPNLCPPSLRSSMPAASTHVHALCTCTVSTLPQAPVRHHGIRRGLAAAFK